jgi:hypothetical protein
MFLVSEKKYIVKHLTLFNKCRNSTEYQGSMWINTTRLDYPSGFINVETSSEIRHKRNQAESRTTAVTSLFKSDRFKWIQM